MPLDTQVTLEIPAIQALLVAQGQQGTREYQALQSILAQQDGPDGQALLDPLVAQGIQERRGLPAQLGGLDGRGQLELQDGLDPLVQQDGPDGLGLLESQDGLATLGSPDGLGLVVQQEILAQQGQRVL